ncbi:MAG: thermonuclease family protein [Sulfurimonas sp.]
MKKIIMVLAVLITASLAENAKLVEIVSENILKVEHNGVTKKIHLVGIELFSKANKRTKKVDLEIKEQLKQKTLAYIKQTLPLGSFIKYHVVYTDEKGVEKVWMATQEMNYKMVRNGYALVDVNDPYLHHAFEMRMTVAMKYAKDKKFGLWADQSEAMASLVDMDCSMCGWSKSKKHQGLTRMDIVKELESHLPKQERVIKLALNKTTR